MINKRNGHINISRDIELAPNDSFEKINNLRLGEIQVVRDMKNGYKWLDLKNVIIDSEYFIFSFGFYNEEFKMLDFVVDLKHRIARNGFLINLVMIDNFLGDKFPLDLNQRAVQVQFSLITRRQKENDLYRPNIYEYGRSSQQKLIASGRDCASLKFAVLYLSLSRWTGRSF